MLRLGIAEADDVPEERAEQTRSPGAAELCPELRPQFLNFLV